MESIRVLLVRDAVTAEVRFLTAQVSSGSVSATRNFGNLLHRLNSNRVGFRMPMEVGWLCKKLGQRILCLFQRAQLAGQCHSHL